MATLNIVFLLLLLCHIYDAEESKFNLKINLTTKDYKSRNNASEENMKSPETLDADSYDINTGTAAPETVAPEIAAPETEAPLVPRNVYKKPEEERQAREKRRVPVVTDTTMTTLDMNATNSTMESTIEPVTKSKIPKGNGKGVGMTETKTIAPTDGVTNSGKNNKKSGDSTATSGTIGDDVTTVTHDPKNTVGGDVGATIGGDKKGGSSDGSATTVGSKSGGSDGGDATVSVNSGSNSVSNGGSETTVSGSSGGSDNNNGDNKVTVNSDGGSNSGSNGGSNTGSDVTVSGSNGGSNGGSNSGSNTGGGVTVSSNGGSESGGSDGGTNYKVTSSSGSVGGSVGGSGDSSGGESGSNNNNDITKQTDKVTTSTNIKKISHILELDKPELPIILGCSILGVPVAVAIICCIKALAKSMCAKKVVHPQ